MFSGISNYISKDITKIKWRKNNNENQARKSRLYIAVCILKH